MTWLTPWHAAIAAGIAIPTLIILYFLKLRRRDLEISTTLLWRKAIQDLQANAPFQRLRRNILLILQLLALVAILAAVGQPQLTGQQVQGQRHVILIDRSGSMAATDEVDPQGKAISRLDAAKQQAIALVESLREGSVFNRGEGDEAMVITFDATAQPVQQFTSDKALLKRSIEAITPTESPTSLEEAIRLAKAHKPKRLVTDATTGQAMQVEGLYGGVPVTLHIYSDGRIPDAERARPAPDDAVEYHQVGQDSAANVGIVGLRSERAYNDPNRLTVFVALANNEEAERTVDVELRVDGVATALKTATLPAASDSGPRLSATEAARAEALETEAAAAVGSARQSTAQSRTLGVGGVVFELERPEGGTVQVLLRQPGTSENLEGDRLAIDNRAWLVVPPAKKVAVAVVSEGDLFLSSAMEGLPLSRLAPLIPAQYQSAVTSGEIAQYDVVIFHNWLPPAPAGDPAGAGLPPGRFLVLGAVPGGRSGLTDKGKGGASAVVDWRRDHPVLRNVNLDEVAIGEGRIVEVAKGSGIQTLASGEATPLVLELSTADTHAIILPFDVGASTWPWKVSFIVFLGNTVKYLGEDAGLSGSGRMVQPGQVLSDRVPTGAAGIRIRTPGGGTENLTAAADGRIVYGPIAEAGLYEVSWEGPQGPMDVEREGRIVRQYAANLLDPQESDVAAGTSVALATDIVNAQSDRTAKATRHLWPFLILGALAVMMAEWFIYNRKVHV